MRSSFKYIVIVFISLLTLESCYDNAGSGMRVKPPALGRMNEIVVIADNELWNSPVQDTFDYYFGSAYPIMPRPEPMFDLRHFSLEELDMEPLRKELRTYVMLADLSRKEARTTKMVKGDLGEAKFNQALAGEVSSSVGKDKWARGQLIIYLFGKDEESLYRVIRESYPALSRRVNLHDEEQLHQKVYGANSNIGLSEQLEEHFGIHIDIPTRYQTAIFDLDQDLVWLRKDEKDAIMNITVTKMPYNSQNQLSTENLKRFRNEFGKGIITSGEVGDYMQINDEDLPVFDYTYDIDGKYTREIRGVWEMANSFMGGPFVSYAILNEEKREIIFVDAFIYAPGKEKRDMMQELEYIVKKAKFQ